MNYQRIYDQIIDRAKKENRQKVKDGAYYEAHHLVPRCMGGEGKVTQWKTHSNIVLLTGREHFMCHLLLSEIYPESRELQFAIWAMVNQTSNKNQQRQYKVSGRLYQRLKIQAALNTQNLHTGRKDSKETRDRKSRAQKRRCLSEETKDKLRKPKPEEFGAKVSKALTGRKRTAEHCSNISKSRLGKSSWAKGKKFTDDHVRNNKLSQKNRREVNQLTLEGEFIKTWDSISDAVKQYGIGVSHCLMGKQKSTKGYKWQYTTPEPPMQRIGGKVKK